MPPAAPLRLPPSRTRRAAALALFVAVLAVHAGVLWREPLRPAPAMAASTRAPAIAVRALALAPSPPERPPPAARPVAGQVPAPVPVPVPDSALGPKPARASLKTAAVKAAARAQASSGGALRSTPDPIPPAPDPPATQPDEGLAAADPQPLPRYRTRLPPAATLHYALLRSGRAGPAELRWQPEATHYSATLLGYASEGGFDADGLAPERHTESRGGRAGRAVNFRREAGRISFSGSQGSAELTPGAQDRLSWLVQLAGVLAAEPGLRAAGSEVQMVVAGVRGEALLWRFEVLGDETLALPIGPVQAALHLRHAPVQVHAMAVDVWLDPARGFLPVQLQMQRPGTPPGAPGSIELRLTASEP